MSNDKPSNSNGNGGYIPNKLNEALVSEFEAKVGHRFTNIAHLKRALLHSSAVSDARLSNERMEFLGDGILSFLVAEMLFERFPEASEGILTQFRAQLVSTKALFLVGEELELEKYIHIGESLYGRKMSKRMLANAVEAVLAAIYFDGGLNAAREFAATHIASKPVGSLQQTAEPRNFKALLQQWTQEIGPELPVYKVVGVTGPEHRKQYTVVVEYAGMCFHSGTAHTKKEAEQLAAQNAFCELSVLADENP